MKDIWIWLPEAIYPNAQTTRYDAFTGDINYVVAEFQKEYTFNKEITSIAIRFSADTEIQLFCNGNTIATGPSCVGGDFLGNGVARNWYYSDQVKFNCVGNKIDLFARVKMSPTRICEFSKGHGGFMLSGTVYFVDGSTASIFTDDTWLARRNGAYVNDSTYDGRIVLDPYVNAEIISDIWNAQPSPIPVRVEDEIKIATVSLNPHDEITEIFEFDKIYAGFICLTSKKCDTVNISLNFRETDEPRVVTENIVLCNNCEYRSFYLQSVGNISATFKNDSDTPATFDIKLITTCYPVTVDAKILTSDQRINEILDVCKHTLKYCRQTHHLDSPRHCEPLACTGDYYIESLMTAFSFGDMRLAKFDIQRTAQLLRYNDGRMFHTTYSLIWVRMLYDVYMIDSDVELLYQSVDALGMLLERFASYIGSNGLIETPPDYMFVDWIYIDGLSMHHPPKALGQTVLNMFYFMALNYAERIYNVIGDIANAHQCMHRSKELQKVVNTLLYDTERGMYFEGLNTPIDQELVNHWQSQNVDKRYYLKHSNILASYTSICDTETCKSLIEKVMNDEIDGDVQPYFQHYLLEAIEMHGLRDKYTIQVINRWRKPIEDCNKGLVEGFFAPEPTYYFDHSHAWGGTPLCSLPKALCGISIEEPGYKKIKLSPALLGLDWATVEIPTPYGMIVCDMKQGCEVKLTIPSEIEYEIIK